MLNMVDDIVTKMSFQKRKNYLVHNSNIYIYITYIILTSLY